MCAVADFSMVNEFFLIFHVSIRVGHYFVQCKNKAHRIVSNKICAFVCDNEHSWFWSHRVLMMPKT